MRNPFLPVLPALALILAACGDIDEPGVTPTPEPTPPPFALAQECTNPEGFSIEYPEGWVTNTEPANELPECSLFDPESVELPDDSLHVPEDIAVFIRVDPVAFDVEEGDTQFEQELDRQERTIDGRDALRREVTHTGEGMYPAGMQTTSYRVRFTDDSALVAVVHDVGEPDYASKQEALDAMMLTLELSDTVP